MIKKTVVRTLSSRPFLSAGERYFNYCAPIFMLHRFRCDDLGIEGHEPKLLASALEFLRKRKFNFVSVDQVADAVASGEPLPERSVAFTLDDGYWDQVETAGRIFANYDCPATYFVATGYISGELWFWDAKIHFLFESVNEAAMQNLRQVMPELNLACLAPSVAAHRVVWHLANRCYSEIIAGIEVLAQTLGVSIPEKAPEKYMPSSWSRLRDMERMGLQVGAHTYQHPLLSRETDECSLMEITRSKHELEANVSNPSSVFCYPVGRAQDFGPREEQFVKQAGFRAAVSAISAPVNTRSSTCLYSMPRFGFPDNIEDFIQYATWIESFKERMRSHR